MALRLPFSSLATHPSAPLLLLVAGQHLQIFNTKEKKFHKPESDLNHSQPISGALFSPDGSFLATTSDAKDLKIWDTSSWACQSTRGVIKRATSLRISRDSQQVFVSDKFGDIVSYNAKTNDEPKLLLGHLSLVTDVELSPLNDFIISADRDEKLRVSHFPHTFIIQSYCLGHSQYVNVVHTPRFSSGDNPLVISGGGDSLVNLWAIKEGRLLSSIDVKKEAEAKLNKTLEPAAVLSITSCDTSKTVIAIAEAVPCLFVFSFKDGVLIPHQTIDLSSNPTDAEFDHLGRLWVSTDNSDELLKCFRFENGECKEGNPEDKEITNLINKEGSVLVDKIPALFTSSQLKKRSKGENKGASDDESSSEGEDFGEEEEEEEQEGSRNKKPKTD